MTENSAQGVDYSIDDRRTTSRFMLALNTTLRRLTGGVFGTSPDGKRNYNALYGYGEDLTFSDYYSMFRRGGIANTVVAKIAKACWRDVPKIMVDDKEVLEDEIAELKNAGLFKFMEKADILNRVGRFSVLVVGLADGDTLDQPLGTANNINNIFFNPYSEDGTTVVEWDVEPSSSRYGLPIMYQVQTTNVGGSESRGIQTQSRKVHFTRVIHMAEGSLDDQFEGCSSLEAPYNALIDILKVRGGSGEAYFKNARQKFALEALKDTQIDTSPDGKALLKTEVEAFTNEQQDFLRLQNMKANVMQPAMASPRDPFDIATEEVAGVTGIPIRALTGKGGGQLTGSEDKATWNALVNDRQTSECDDYLGQALAIFGAVGFIKLPPRYTVEWPVQQSLNEKEAAEVLDSKASAAEKIGRTIRDAGEDAPLEDIFEAAGFDDINIKTVELDDDGLPPNRRRGSRR